MSLFLKLAMLSAFLICGEYGMSRPVSCSLFLTHFSSKLFPWAWLATVPLNFAAVWAYNRYLSKVGQMGMLLIVAVVSMALNSLSASFSSGLPVVAFLQYVWKDIYVLLMLKQLWSMIHSTTPQQEAKSLYGRIYGCGTVGAILGALASAFLAERIGSESILYFTLPIYTLVCLVYYLAYQYSKHSKHSGQAIALFETPKIKDSVQLITRSAPLMAALWLVVFMQVSAGLMEYQFNAHLELNIAAKDLRTAYTGKLVALINGCSLLLQFFGAGALFKRVGVEKSHQIIPLLLTAGSLLIVSAPFFPIISFCFVFLKTIDFSLSNLVREMLYVPLGVEEKFRGKAIIDVFAYRSAKALLSVGILALQWVAGENLLPCVRALSLGVCMLWIWITFKSLKQARI